MSKDKLVGDGEVSLQILPSFTIYLFVKSNAALPITTKTVVMGFSLDIPYSLKFVSSFFFDHSWSKYSPDENVICIKTIHKY